VTFFILSLPQLKDKLARFTVWCAGNDIGAIDVIKLNEEYGRLGGLAGGHVSNAYYVH
jgi:hypothetical protein